MTKRVDNLDWGCSLFPPLQTRGNDSRIKTIILQLIKWQMLMLTLFFRASKYY